MKIKNDRFVKLIKKFAFGLFLICIAGYLISVALLFYPLMDGWFYYRTGWEIVQVLARLSLTAIILGLMTAFIIVALTAVLTVFLHKTSSLVRFIRWVRQALVVLAVFVFFSLFLRNVLSWFNIVAVVNIEPQWKYAVWLIFLVVFVGVLWKRDQRSKTIAICGNLFASKITRRGVIAWSGLSAAVWATGRVLSDNVSAKAETPGADITRLPHPNILLITFDALNAEDMSLYGYHLPTTPHISRFADRATNFRQFYACSTFTTPSVVAFSSGRYISSTHVLQLSGRLRDQNCVRTLPSVLHHAGYETAASIANAAAHPAICGISGYDIAPPPPIRDTVIRECFNLGEPEISIDSAYISGFTNNQINRIRRAIRPNLLLERNFPPEDSFAQAKKLWQGLQGPKFLHVHVYAPHLPYQPSAAFRGRFLKPNAIIGLTEWMQLDRYVSPTTNKYLPQYQPLLDQMRLRYDEWIAEADAAFGEFLTEMEQTGGLKNTIVAVSADHGESFLGGFWSHGGPNMLRSIIHVPFIVRVPGQSEKQEVSLATDAASLAPTLLDFAGIPVPHWMDGNSLRARIETPRPSDHGFAFTQYFERNSAFMPITKGAIGIIDGEYQYIVTLPSGQGRLYKLSNAHLHSDEIPARRPDVARALRERIRARFSDIAIPA
jgi:arylsulfatase A-like enzyme